LYNVEPGRLVSCLEELVIWDNSNISFSCMLKQKEEKKKLTLTERIYESIDRFFYNVFFSAINDLDDLYINLPRLCPGERATVLEVIGPAAKILKLNGTIGWVEKGRLLIIC